MAKAATTKALTVRAKAIYKDGSRLAYMAFDHNFREFYRHDPNRYMLKIKASDLKLCPSK